MSHIVVGIDGSPTSRKAFHEAVREATWREADVHAVHVVHFSYFVGYQDIGLDVEVLRARGRDLLHREIHDLGMSYGGEFPVAVTPVFKFGHPGVELTNAAEAGPDGEPATMVVLGSRGYGGFRGLTMGSVTTYAIHHLQCPVLVIPPDSTDE